MKKNKIIFLAKLPPPYIGPALATQVILNSRLKNNFELIHLDTSDHRDINTLGAFDLKNFFIAIKQYFLLFWYILKHNPDLIYFPSAQTTIAYFRDIPLILIPKLFGKKVIAHLRGGYFRNWYDQSSWFTKFVIKKIHTLIDGQIVLGDNLKYMFESIIDEEKIFIVPNGKNTELIPNYVIKKYKQTVNILFLSNFHKSKGIIDTLLALQHLLDLEGKIKVFFAGYWRAEDTKTKFFKILKTLPPGMVEIVGPVKGEDKNQLLLNSDIFVFPTYYRNEGHPWVIIEALAAGLPIVTTNHAAIPESVYDGVNGFLVEKNNPRQIAEKIRILYENPNIRLMMSKKSRSIYEEKFTEDIFIKNLTYTFKTVLNRR